MKTTPSHTPSKDMQAPVPTCMHQIFIATRVLLAHYLPATYWPPPSHQPLTCVGIIGTTSPLTYFHASCDNQVENDHRHTLVGFEEICSNQEQRYCHREPQACPYLALVAACRVLTWFCDAYFSLLWPSVSEWFKSLMSENSIALITTTP